MNHADPKSLSVHPAAHAVPDLPPRQYAALKSSIERHGIRHPLLADAEGRVIDGRNRLKIALEIGLEVVPVVTVDGTDAATLACESAVARRNLTASGRVLVLYMAHPALKQDSKARGHGNLIPAARQKKALGVTEITPRESKEFAFFQTLADRYQVPREYFSTLAEIERGCDGDETRWKKVQRRILEEEISIPRLSAGESGARETKGLKKTPTQYHKLADRTAVSLVNVFTNWPRIKWPASHPEYRMDATANLAKAFTVMPDELRHIAAESVLSWPREELELLSGRVRGALSNSARKGQR